MTTASMVTTAEQLFQEAPGLGRCELVGGEPRMMSPAGSLHGAGTRLVWIVDPATQSLAAHAVDGTINRFTTSDTVPAGDVVPGFSLALDHIFG